jgi:putative membrane protein
VPAGTTDNVVVTLDEAIAADASIWAAFYGDHDRSNELEIGGPDMLLALGYGVATQPLALGMQLAAPVLQEGDNTQEGQDQTGQDQGQGTDQQGQDQGQGETDAGEFSPLDDQSFLEQAIAAGLAEVMAAQLALDKAESGDVRAFAERMVQDHGQANDQLVALAEQFGVQPPQQMDERHRQIMQQLSLLAGAEFDRQYMRGQVEDHRAAIELFSQKAQGDSAVAQFAAQALPVLQQHLDLAVQLNQTLGGGEAQVQTAQQGESGQQDQGQTQGEAQTQEEAQVQAGEQVQSQGDQQGQEQVQGEAITQGQEQAQAQEQTQDQGQGQDQDQVQSAQQGDAQAQQGQAQTGQDQSGQQSMEQPATLPVTGASGRTHPLLWFSGGLIFLLLVAGERFLRRIKR